MAALSPPIATADLRAPSANRAAQLRAYSYADLLLMLWAAGATGGQALACSALWFGFLVQLEWRHRDRGRAHWPAAAWIIPWCGAVIAVHSVAVLPFLVLSFLYAGKKRVPVLAAVAPLLNGGLKAALLLLTPASTAFALTALGATMARNLLGDWRDVEKDRGEGVRTLPVRLGARRDVTWLYPAGLAATSILWVALGGLPLVALVAALLVEWVTYPLTPR